MTTPTPRADQVAAAYGTSHPLYAQMRDFDLQAAADQAALSRRSQAQFEAMFDHAPRVDTRTPAQVAATRIAS